MKLLLDTHALLWWLSDSDQLGARTRDLIADPGHDVLVSAASLWDIVVKRRVGKLEVDVGEVAVAVERQGFDLIAINTGHLRVVAGLPMHHRDPFDHLLIAQAIAEDATFVSGDRHVAQYPVRSLTPSL